MRRHKWLGPNNPLRTSWPWFKTNGIPFWLVGEFTAHFRLPILVVGLGCSLGRFCSFRTAELRRRWRRSTHLRAGGKLLHRLLLDRSLKVVAYSCVPEMLLGGFPLNCHSEGNFEDATSMEPMSDSNKHTCWQSELNTMRCILPVDCCLGPLVSLSNFTRRPPCKLTPIRVMFVPLSVIPPRTPFEKDIMGMAHFGYQRE